MSSELDRHTIEVQDEIINDLRELVEAGKEDQKSIDELVDENLLLRGLLKEALESPRCSGVWEKIQKEVGNEQWKR